jgi:hypothetical protein
MDNRPHPARRTVKATQQKRSRRVSYCCVRFKESVREGKFVHALGPDETEWFMPEWFHIYYCPFCGKLVKGRGTGTFDRRRPKQERK